MEKAWLDYVSAIGAIATPLLVLFLTGIGWQVRRRLERAKELEDQRIERIRELEDQLRADRVAIYNALLEPFFVLFTTDAVFEADPKYKGKKKDALSIGRMLTVEYRKVGFQLALIGTDAVVRAYNELMQFFYHQEESELPLETKTAQWVALLGTLFLEIRKSMGNEHTSLDRGEMLEWFMTDARQMMQIAQEAERLPIS
ncbi:hypothetical protein [Geobacter sulfurreducens]|uniref:hypothetical protein n=1 Tax=Geobacter sulfurreducens TaxID=35554 RepID=UPI0020B6DAF5|nr:hypothetical protein [Geobacter sulfurreducens]UTG93268.1 hypothetical protein J8622_02730 [Geobacter sulfurreducens]